MNSNPLTTKYESISRVCGLVVIAIGATALTGWFTNSVVLKGIHATYIPMAPNTALIFILLAVFVAIFRLSPARYVYWIRLAALLSMAVVSARLGEYLLRMELQVDHWLFAFPAERLGLAPVGKMAFFTAATFLFLALALLLLTSSSRRWANDAAKALSVVVTFIGLMFSLGIVVPP